MILSVPCLLRYGRRAERQGNFEPCCRLLALLPPSMGEAGHEAQDAALGDRGVAPKHVPKPMIGVLRLCDAGQRVVFDSPGGDIQHEGAGQTTAVHGDSNVYRMEADVIFNYGMGADGRTIYERMMGTAGSHETVEIGESIHYTYPKITRVMKITWRDLARGILVG